MASFVLATLNRFLVHSKPFSSRFSSISRNAHIVMTDDSSVIVCWHPEQCFPYDKSLPVPEKEEKKEINTVLKVQSSKELLSVLRPKKEEVVRQELMAMTHTVKHIWFPPKFRFKRKPRPTPDRPYL